MRAHLLAAGLLLLACAPDPKADATFAPVPGYPHLGVRWDTQGEVLDFRVVSRSAERLELWLYDAPTAREPRLAVSLRQTGALFSVGLALSDLAGQGLAPPFYYGYRAWGPNWLYDPSWRPGDQTGFLADVDSQGHRFNPNKLLLDPYALEVSHDPVGPGHDNGAAYTSGAAHRLEDTGPFAPKGVILPPAPRLVRGRPTRPLRDEVIYEAHLRGLTKNDPSVPAALRGTYAGAALKADYLRELGVTAVELLPLFETPNDQNELTADARGDNYWGYAPLSLFAPDRRYAADQRPGGPTAEVQSMVDAFHAAGLKVYVDVVYNHTAEGGASEDGASAALYSLRGLDNPVYYQLQTDARRYRDDTGTGANLNTGEAAVRDLIVASMRYWKDVIGVDGFRVDLATVLGNRCTRSCFDFDPADPRSPLVRAAAELPARPAEGGDGVDLIAEPWAVSAGTYELGGFPAPWAEWNGDFRDTVRRDQNLLGVWDVTPRQLFARLSGSPDLFAPSGRKPWHSVNYVVSHDGFTLRDLYSYDAAQNDQPWPFGPSDGGAADNYAWDYDGDEALQQRAARTGITLLAVSAGVPLFTAGDELWRTQRGNNNPYNLDSEATWIDWASADETFRDFVRGALALRAAAPRLRPADYWTDVQLLDETGAPASEAYLDAADRHFLAWHLADPLGPDVYVAYNGWREDVVATLPAGSWRLALDSGTAAATPSGGERLEATRAVLARAVVVAVGD